MNGDLVAFGALVALALIVAWPTVLMLVAHLIYAPSAPRRARPEFE